MRGEYSVMLMLNFILLGSPPLAWGIQETTCFFVPVPRITPTCVGNTRCFYFALKGGEDHPHLRGEYTRKAPGSAGRAGSPPLAWGIQIEGTFSSPCQGITPTCVGNTRLPAPRGWIRRDHPHLRGEYFTCKLDTGSPPLAWGIPVVPAAPLLGWRITPTCVGNTDGGAEREGSEEDHPHLRGEYFYRATGKERL